jgi:hypothetical protein
MRRQLAGIVPMPSKLPKRYRQINYFRELLEILPTPDFNHPQTLCVGRPLLYIEKLVA